MLSGRPGEPHRALQWVAAFEAFKGAVVLGAGLGLLGLTHRDLAQVAAALVTELHIDPQRHAAGIFVEAAAHVTSLQLWGLALLALGYAAIRGSEAYGLWLNRRWAAWLGAASGAIYLPVEVYELVHKPGWLKVATLLSNVAVVAFLVWTLWQARRAEAAATRPG